MSPGIAANNVAHWTPPGVVVHRQAEKTGLVGGGGGGGGPIILVTLHIMMNQEPKLPLGGLSPLSPRKKNETLMAQAAQVGYAPMLRQGQSASQVVFFWRIFRLLPRSVGLRASAKILEAFRVLFAVEVGQSP